MGDIGKCTLLRQGDQRSGKSQGISRSGKSQGIPLKSQGTSRFSKKSENFDFWAKIVREKSGNFTKIDLISEKISYDYIENHSKTKNHELFQNGNLFNYFL